MSKKQTDESVHDPALLTALERVAQEINILRSAVDELREELAWEIRQMRRGPSEGKPLQLTSFPADPTVPDFHERVDAVNRKDVGVPSMPPTSFAELIARLTGEPGSLHMGIDDWDDVDEFPPDEVIAIDQATHDWFLNYQLIVKHESNWTLIDDRAGWFYLLWHRDDQHFLRLVTDDQQQAITRFTWLQPVDEMAAVEPPPQPAAKSGLSATAQHQRSLW